MRAKINTIPNVTKFIAPYRFRIKIITAIAMDIVPYSSLTKRRGILFKSISLITPPPVAVIIANKLTPNKLKFDCKATNEPEIEKETKPMESLNIKILLFRILSLLCSLKKILRIKTQTTISDGYECKKVKGSLFTIISLVIPPPSAVRNDAIKIPRRSNLSFVAT